LLAQRAAGPNADQIAFDDGQEAVSFAGLMERALERAGSIQQLGVTRGDRVALVMSAWLPFVEVFWGLQMIGAVPCAFNPSVPGAMLARRIERMQPRIVISDEDAAGLRASPAEIGDVEIQPSDLALLQYTSGTSGEPRAAMINHNNVLAYLRATEGITTDDVFVGWVPPWHDLGLMRFVITPVHLGLPCFLVEPSIWTIPDWLATISRSGGTLTAAPDFCYRLATRMVAPGRVDLSSLRFASIAAEPVRQATIEGFERRFQVPGALVPGYGLAEATVGVTTHLPGERYVVDEHGNVSCGKAMPGIEVRAGNGRSAPEEILVRGEVVFDGYFEARQDTNRVLVDGWLRTGDTGYLDQEGRLFVLGRRSAMIKRGGAVIAPRELEEAAERAPGVRLSAAVGAGPYEDTVTVVVEARTSASDSAAQVATEVSRQIVAAAGFAPGRVLVVAPRAIPRTVNGKVSHDRLRAAILDGSLNER
jgi:acyl-CoA synthetase (AMP-forming)/AMP-acid ligase II